MSIYGYNVLGVACNLHRMLHNLHRYWINNLYITSMETFVNQLRHKHVILAFHLIIQPKLYMTMNIEANKINLTPVIYIVIMVVVFSLAI